MARSSRRSRGRPVRWRLEGSHSNNSLVIFGWENLEKSIGKPWCLTPRAVPWDLECVVFGEDFEAKVLGSMSIIAQEPGDRIDRYWFLAGWWLTYPSEKYESQLGLWHSQYIMETSLKSIKIPSEWKVIKAMFQTTNQLVFAERYIVQIFFGEISGFGKSPKRPAFLPHGPC